MHSKHNIFAHSPSVDVARTELRARDECKRQRAISQSFQSILSQDIQARKHDNAAMVVLLTSCMLGCKAGFATTDIDRMNVQCTS